MPDDPADLHPSTFAPLTGTAFSVSLDGADPVPLTLVEVTELPRHEDQPRPDPFSLVFTGPRQYQFRQGIYPLEHDKLGRLDVFLVPIQPVEDGLPRLEAVFN